MSRIPVALVTGSSRGLGRGIAVELAKAGFSVAINYAGNRAAADETASLCQAVASAPGARYVPFQADVSSQADRERMVAEVLKEYGGLDALVNNAGIGVKVRADITTATEESFEDLIRTNLMGPYFLTQSVVNHWLAHPGTSALPTGPKIVFVTSISAYTASLNRGEYCVSKAGLAMAVQLWASRLAAEGIGVFEIRPGIMATDMTSGVKEKYDKIIGEGQVVPQKRWGTGEDVGLATRAVLEGRFPYSTGQVLNVDGGFHLKTL